MKPSNRISEKALLLTCLIIFLVLAVLSRCSWTRQSEYRGYRFHATGTDQTVFGAVR